MLGLSLTKILVTILIAVAVWKSFTVIGRLAREREVRAVRNTSKQRADSAWAGHDRADRVLPVWRLLRPQAGLPVRQSAGVMAQSRDS